MDEVLSGPLKLPGRVEGMVPGVVLNMLRSIVTWTVLIPNIEVPLRSPSEAESAAADVEESKVLTVLVLPVPGLTLSLKLGKSVVLVAISMVIFDILGVRSDQDLAGQRRLSPRGTRSGWRGSG